jgi:predicted membrane-bound spermidine synthase
MTGVIPEGEVGIAKAEHFDISEDQSRMSALRDGLPYVPAGRYARLLMKGEIMMSDTEMERRTNLEIVHRAHGRVLIAGLGLGVILVPILAKEGVTEVVVIERHQDMIDLIAPRFDDPKLRIIHADVNEWRQERDERFDIIYFDIWPDISTANIPEMARLHRSFARWLNRSDDAA